MIRKLFLALTAAFASVICQAQVPSLGIKGSETFHNVDVKTLTDLDGLKVMCT